jgi:cell pole-organizing protein PopZ
MGSMERAPEPTMEEILASIRRIISDEEAKPAAAPPPSPAPVQAADDEKRDLDEVEADHRIIDDIARVLSGGAAPAGEDDDILDLTKELSELRTVADETTAMPELRYPSPAQARAEPSAPAEISLSDTTETLIEAEEPSALDQAIAMLKARELKPLMPEPPVEPFAEAAAPEAAAEDPASEEPELVLTEAETVVEFETAPPPEMESVFPAEPAVAASSTESVIVLPPPPPESEPVIEAEPPSWQNDIPEWSKSEEPAWAKEEPAWAKNEQSDWAKGTEPAQEPEPAHVNGGGMHKQRDALHSDVNFKGRSLEDSVKEMLRPLLREWLDEHMSRVLEAALRDELKDAEERWQRNEQRRWPY